MIQAETLLGVKRVLLVIKLEQKAKMEILLRNQDVWSC